jgi:two-component system chemotaxis response regulator CheB
VEEATDGAVLASGRVYLAPGGATHLELAGPAGGPWHCRLTSQATVNGHRPSVDVLFKSVAATARARAVGVILTGMGRDGAQGLLAMRQAGARTFGQDEASCVVYGMPKVAFELGGVQSQVPLHAAAAAMLAACNAKPGDVACRPLQQSRC